MVPWMVDWEGGHLAGLSRLHLHQAWPEAESSPLGHLGLGVAKAWNTVENGPDLNMFLGFLVAQLVKNPPAMWETWVQSLGWEDPLEKGKVTHSNILAWRIPWTV